MPDWPIFNKHPVKWLESVEGRNVEGKKDK